MLNLAQLRERRENGEKGFTLIELLVVVVIIGILVAIAIPVYLNYTKGAADKSAESDLRNAISALEQCEANTGSYPDANGTGVSATCTGITTSENVQLGYFVNDAKSVYTLAAWNTKGAGSTSPYCYYSGDGGAIKKHGGAVTQLTGC